MKHIHLLLILFSAASLASCAPAPKKPAVPDPEQQRRVTELERQLQMQHTTSDRLQMLAASLGVGCVLLLIVGTALGAKTRHDAFTSP